MIVFRDIVRKSRALAEEEAKLIFKNVDWGVLSVIGDDGYPYGVPINYGYAEHKFYIHSTSRDSHKIDAIRRNDKVCITVVERHTMMPEKYTTDYKSAIAFGRARIIENDSEKREAMAKMMQSLAPEFAQGAMEHCGNKTNGFVMIEMIPEHIAGKERK